MSTTLKEEKGERPTPEEEEKIETHKEDSRSFPYTLEKSSKKALAWRDTRTKGERHGLEKREVVKIENGGFVSIGKKNLRSFN